MNRDEHLQWAKQRALWELEHSGCTSALTSLIVDFSKHPELKNHLSISLGLKLLGAGQLNSSEVMRKFIEDVK